MSTRFKTMLPAVVVLVVGMAGMTYLKYSEKNQTTPEPLSRNPEQQAQVLDAGSLDEGESETRAVPERSRDGQSDARESNCVCFYSWPVRLTKAAKERGRGEVTSNLRGGAAVLGSRRLRVPSGVVVRKSTLPLACCARA